MNPLFLVLAAVAGLGGLACTIIILIGAFRDSIWKGLVSFLCGCYLLYYAIFEFDHEYKWGIVAGACFGNAIAAGLLRAGGYR
jgi:hypothetical protein